jgi:CTP synthase
MQVMVIELARHALNSDEPNSTEFERTTMYPVIDVMPEQKAITELGGTMRLGIYPCHLVPGTKAYEAYGQEVVQERHRHRFELNNAYRDILAQAGLILSGLSPDRKLVEVSEMANHPWMVGSQFHPEFKSRPNRPHPLFVGLVRAAKVHRDARQPAQVIEAPLALERSDAQ